MSCCSEETKFSILRMLVCCIIGFSFAGVIVALILQKAIIDLDACRRDHYRPSFNQVTWADAKQLCESTFGEQYSLATVETEEDVEHLFLVLENITDTPFWIGAVYDEVNQDFLWDGRNDTFDRITINALWDHRHPGIQDNDTRLVILRESEPQTPAPKTIQIHSTQPLEVLSSTFNPLLVNITQSPPPPKSPLLRAHHKNTKQRYLCGMTKNPCAQAPKDN